MDKTLLKYTVIFGLTAFIFSNFIACGARMYKVSLENDHASNSIPSHAKDLSSEFYGIHAIDGWKSLPIPFQVSFELNEAQINGLTRAMRTWETAAGQKLFDFRGVEQTDGDAFKELYSSLRDPINGHYLDDNWQKTGKSSMVLATTIWSNTIANRDEIATADIHFNSQYYLIGDSYKISQNPSDQREIVDMESLALHELGHLLGLSHISEEEDKNSIMNPSLYIGEGLATRGISRQDVKRIQQIYPCENTDGSCELDVIISKLAALENDNSEQEERFFAQERTQTSSEDAHESDKEEED